MNTQIDDDELDLEFEEALANLITKGMIIEHKVEGQEPSYEIAPAGVVALGKKLN